MAASEKDRTGSGRRVSRSDDTARRPADNKARKSSKRTAAWAMRSAASQLQELLGRAPESVSAIKRTEDGWEADVEVLELERVPETTSVLGSYHVTLDEEGDLLAYERTRRYTRGQIDRRR
ncbi:gas vesicle protein GvpO [Streptomyces broussonetiae]|uniref:Gas vesicle protein n=1 Tax=Streptomyces broussonetiae TaxID=2686304 RepID=A0A6I6NE38_9ACTN|nr:gas vesicle protein [Streptomyces broussonetiae]QHA08310.1 gas vesicle protein [Streptomyces broussonetiae]